MKRLIPLFFLDLFSYFSLYKMVRTEGLEPARLSAPDPKSGASANFATSAVKIFLTALILLKKILKSRKIIKSVAYSLKFCNMPQQFEIFFKEKQ